MSRAKGKAVQRCIRHPRSRPTIYENALYRACGMAYVRVLCGAGSCGHGPWHRSPAQAVAAWGREQDSLRLLVRPAAPKRKPRKKP